MTPDYWQDPRVPALDATLRTWLANNPGWSTEPNGLGWLQQRQASDIAVDLLPALEQMDIRLAGLLESPDGQLIRVVASSVLPYREVFLLDLFSEAVLLAAQAQNKRQKLQAGLLVGAGALLLVGIVSTAGETP